MIKDCVVARVDDDTLGTVLLCFPRWLDEIAGIGFAPGVLAPCFRTPTVQERRGHIFGLGSGCLFVFLFDVFG